MTVEIKKPEIDIREKINYLDRPSGMAGEAMLRAETVRDQQDLIGVGRKNFTINGDMRVNQRGFTTATNPQAADYFIDRWTMGSSTTNCSVSWNQNVNIGHEDNLNVNTLRFDYTGSGGMDVYQIYEDWETLSGKQVTVSFWYRTNIDGCIIRQWSTMSPAYIPTSTEWKKFTCTFRFGTLVSGGRAANTPSIGIWSGPGTTVTNGSFFEFTQYQLEISPVATPFEYRPYTEELSLCQRYFYSIDGSQAATSGKVNVGHGVWNGSNGAYIGVQLPRRMRVLPILDYGNLAWYRIVAEAISWRGLTNLNIHTDASSPHFVTLFASATSDTRGLATRMTTQSTGAILKFDADF